jgi:hypothetical protein
LIIIQDLLKCTAIISTDQLVINKAVNSGFDDFEDGVQYISAKSIPKISLIVSRDKKGFKKSTIPVMDAVQAIAFI